MPDVTIPYNFKPRSYQLALLRAVDSGKCKNIFIYWHRRAGKDLVLWNIAIKRALQIKGIHYYLLPTYSQARKIIWDGINNDGFKFLDYMPDAIIKRKNESEMKIELINGSIIQLIGTDRYDAIRGTNPVTCIFSEYAYQNPMAYEVVKPILQANNGLAVFNTTPNGKNHAADLREIAEKSEDWFYEKLTVDDTKALDKKALDKVRAEGMSEEMIQQEFFCSEEAGALGALYADRLQEIRENNQICNGVYDENLPVHTAWDVGYSDDTAITFFQLFGKEIRIIDFYQNYNMTMPEYVNILKEKNYKYSNHFLPWDAYIKSVSVRKSTVDVLQEHGLDNIKRVPNMPVQEGIQLVRMYMPRMWFEKNKTEELIKALINYQRKYDEKHARFSKEPLHNWASHPADSMRYVAIAIKEHLNKEKTTSYEEAAISFIDHTVGEKQHDPNLGKPEKEFREYKKALRVNFLDNI